MTPSSTAASLTCTCSASMTAPSAMHGSGMRAGWWQTPVSLCAAKHLHARSAAAPCSQDCDLQHHREACAAHAGRRFCANTGATCLCPAGRSSVSHRASGSSASLRPGALCRWWRPRRQSLRYRALRSRPPLLTAAGAFCPSCAVSRAWTCMRICHFTGSSDRSLSGPAVIYQCMTGPGPSCDATALGFRGLDAALRSAWQGGLCASCKHIGLS